LIVTFNIKIFTYQLDPEISYYTFYFGRQLGEVKMQVYFILMHV